MGNAMVAMSHSQAGFYNPAGLALIKRSSAAASFHAPIDLLRLSTTGLNVNLVSKVANIGVAVERFGDRLYNESKVGLIVSKKIERVALGLKASYLNAAVENISSTGTPLLEFGVIAQLSNEVDIGFHAYNLTGAKLLDTQKLPTVLRAGAAFRPSNKITLAGEAQSIPGVNTFAKFGLEYEIMEFLALRSGINTGFRTVHFGVGFKKNNWVLDYAVHSHPSLGFYNHLTLQLNIGQNEK